MAEIMRTPVASAESWLLELSFHIKRESCWLSWFWRKVWKYRHLCEAVWVWVGRWEKILVFSCFHPLSLAPSTLSIIDIYLFRYLYSTFLSNQDPIQLMMALFSPPPFTPTLTVWGRLDWERITGPRSHAVSRVDSWTWVLVWGTLMTEFLYILLCNFSCCHLKFSINMTTKPQNYYFFAWGG